MHTCNYTYFYITIEYERGRQCHSTFVKEICNPSELEINLFSIVVSNARLSVYHMFLLNEFNGVLFMKSTTSNTYLLHE